MPTERTSMRLIKDVLRLKFESDLSLRQIARSLNIGLGTVSLMFGLWTDGLTINKKIKKRLTIRR